MIKIYNILLDWPHHHLFMAAIKILLLGIRLKKEILFLEIKFRQQLILILENFGSADFLIGD